MARIKYEQGARRLCSLKAENLLCFYYNASESDSQAPFLGHLIEVWDGGLELVMITATPGNSDADRLLRNSAEIAS